MYDFNYRKASSVEDAVSAVTGVEDGRFLAGGMTIIPTVKQRLAKPSDLVDLAGIDGLAGISVSGGVCRDRRHGAPRRGPRIRPPWPTPSRRWPGSPA